MKNKIIIKEKKENENKKEINENKEKKENSNLININQKKEALLKNEEDKKIINNIQEKKENKKVEVDKTEKNKLKEENSNKKDLNYSDEEEDDGDFNLDNLTDEEKMALIQQREILLKLQEEAEARGEHFDIQEYLAQLAEQSEEDDEYGKQENKSDKLNKSF